MEQCFPDDTTNGLNSSGERLPCCRRRSIRKETVFREGAFVHILARNITAVVGLKEAITAKRWWIKAAWFLLLLLGTAATAYYVYQAANDYLKGPTAVKVNFIEVGAIPYPPLELCVPTWLDAIKAMNNGLSEEALMFSNGYIRSAADRLKPIELTNTGQAETEFRRFFEEKNFSNFRQYLDNVSLNAVFANDLGGVADNEIGIICDNCDKSLGIRKILRDYGVCYQVHIAQPNIKRFRNDRPTDVVIAVPDRTNNLYQTHSFFLAYIQDMSASMPLVFSYAKVSMLFLARQRYRRYSTEQQPCIDDDNYSSEQCMERCYATSAANVSGCVLFNEYNDLVHTLDELCNRYTSRNIQTETDHAQLLTLCADRCTVPCRTTMYQVSIAPLTTELSSFPLYAISVIIIVDSTVVSGTVVEFVEFSTYSFASLIGNIGGTLGIFIGCTLMTFMQLILSLIEYLVDRLLER